MTELKIKEKYFNAILQLQKPFEIRHKSLPENEIVKLTEIGSNRYIIFKTGKSTKINNVESIMYENGNSFETIQNRATKNYLITDTLNSEIYLKDESWYDKFCWEYIQEKESYIIPIKEIIEVKQ